MAGTKGGKNRKLGRMEKWCKGYTAGGMQEKNKKRRMRRHILRNPSDKTTLSLFEKLWGTNAQIVVTRNGKATGETMTKRAGRKLERKNDKGLQLILRTGRMARRQARKAAAERAAERQKTA